MASIVYTWDATFNSSPAGSQSIRLGDDRIRDTRAAIDERASREMYWGAGDTNSQHGRLRAGAARAYYQDTEPTVAPDGDTLGTLDNGRIWITATGKAINTWDGTQWVPSGVLPLTRITIAGTLSTGTNLVPSIVFPSAFTVNHVVARVGTAPTGAALRFDMNKNGVASQSIFGANNYVEIAATENAGSQSDFDATNAVFSAGDYLTFDIDQVGSTEAGKNLSITIVGVPS